VTLIEILVIAVCGIVGYSIVNWLFKRKVESAGFQRNGQTEEENFQKSKAEPSSPRDRSNEWFEVLEVSATASLHEISEAYKSKIKQYHPDRVSHLGSEFRQMAEVKSKELNAAYQLAKSLRTR